MKTSHSLPWDPIIFLWNLQLQKCIIFQLTSKCFLSMVFPTPNLSLLVRGCESKFSCLLGLLSHHFLQAANYLEGGAREGACGPSPPPSPLAITKKNRSLFSLSKHTPSLQGAFRSGQGGCLDWDAMLASTQKRDHRECQLSGAVTSKSSLGSPLSPVTSCVALGNYFSIVDFCYLEYKMGLLMAMYKGFVRFK